MGLFKPDAPKPPDPAKVAAAQTKSNIETAREQARLGMTGQDTPWGSVSYVTDPTSPSGYRAVTDLSPEQQALLQQSQDLTAQFGGIQGGRFNIGEDLLGRIAGQGDFDINAARGTEISDIQRTFLDPQWAQREEAVKSDLLNRGIRPGTPAYETAMRQFTGQREGAYNQMFLDAYKTATDSALKERQLPYQELAAILGGAVPTQQPGQFGTAAAPTPGVAPTDVIGPTYNSFNAQNAQYGQQLGGLYGLGSAALGGWASAGFPGAAAALGFLSDRRVKTDIVRIGTDPRGWGVYRYRYIGDDDDELGWQLGYMADEVEQYRPEVVFTSATGIKAINYAALAQ
jgi:hypothetical protein